MQTTRKASQEAHPRHMRKPTFSVPGASTWETAGMPATLVLAAPKYSRSHEARATGNAAHPKRGRALNFRTRDDDDIHSSEEREHHEASGKKSMTQVAHIHLPFPYVAHSPKSLLTTIFLLRPSITREIKNKKRKKKNLPKKKTPKNTKKILEDLYPPATSTKTTKKTLEKTCGCF
jgi:hypothetical protein